MEASLHGETISLFLYWAVLQSVGLPGMGAEPSCSFHPNQLRPLVWQRRILNPLCWAGSQTARPSASKMLPITLCHSRTPRVHF